MERTEEALRERVRETPLSERLTTCEKYIASMCAERRPPKMTIPLQHYDEDFYIYTTLADAQATIAALQARVQELEQWVQDQSTANLETMRHTDEMQSRAMEAEQQLTQRTAELEAANKWKLELCNLTPGGSEFADDPAYCAQWVRKSRENQHNVILDKYREAKALKAELERVRSLVEALPKVEGEVTVRDITALCWANDGTYGSINCKEQLVSLLQERQKLC